jgi:hypothetical protein
MTQMDRDSSPALHQLLQSHLIEQCSCALSSVVAFPWEVLERLLRDAIVVGPNPAVYELPIVLICLQLKHIHA